MTGTCGDTPHRPASEVYRVEIEEPSIARRLLRQASLLAFAWANAGDAPSNPGGRSARIIEIATGRCVAEVTEVIGDDVSDVDAAR